MRNRISYCILISTLFCLAIRTTASATVNPKKTSPLSNFYINDVVCSMRNALPDHAYAYPLEGQAGLDLNNYEVARPNANVVVSFPWLVLTGYFEPSSLSKDFRDLQTEDSGVYLGNVLKKHSGVNVILKLLNRFPAYARVGWDRAPTGWHASEIMSASTLVTQQLYQTKGIVLSGGFDYTLTPDQRLSASVSWRMEQPVVVNTRYQKTSPTSLSHWIAIDRLDVGAALGYHRSDKKRYSVSSTHGQYGHPVTRRGYVPDVSRSPLFNFNIDVAIVNYKFRLEYLRHPDTGIRHSPINSAWHTELTRHFSKLPLTNRHIPFTVVCGYERGPRLQEEYGAAILKPQSSLFGAGKIQLWKQRITLIGGGQWNFLSKSKKPEPLFRLMFSI